jgi:hypothetical protein
LRYNRFRFFIFLFFMQKLSGNSIDKFYKNCSVFTRNPTKLILQFFNFLRFSTQFTNFSQNTNTIQETDFSQPLELYDSLHICPYFSQRTLEVFPGLQCGPRTWPLAAPAKFRQLRRRVGRGRWGEGLGAHHASV